MELDRYLAEYHPDRPRLKAYGFVPEGEALVLRRRLAGSIFAAFSLQGAHFFLTVYDDDTPEKADYVPFQAAAADGPYVSLVRERAQALLEDILRQGFVRDSLRDQILAQARQEYGTEPCFPWAEYPGHCTLKAPNGKWYGLVMQVPYAVLGIGKAGRADVLNVKNLPEKIQALVDGEHFLPAYHMNKKYWLSVLLDSPAVLPQAQALLRESYALVAEPGRRSGRKQ